MKRLLRRNWGASRQRNQPIEIVSTPISAAGVPPRKTMARTNARKLPEAFRWPGVGKAVTSLTTVKPSSTTNSAQFQSAAGACHTATAAAARSAAICAPRIRLVGRCLPMADSAAVSGHREPDLFSADAGETFSRLEQNPCSVAEYPSHKQHLCGSRGSRGRRRHPCPEHEKGPSQATALWVIQSFKSLSTALVPPAHCSLSLPRLPLPAPEAVDCLHRFVAEAPENLCTAGKVVQKLGTGAVSTAPKA